jgi:hypothetical protein
MEDLKSPSLWLDRDGKVLVLTAISFLHERSSTRDSCETELSPDFVKAPSKKASAVSDLPL